MTNKDHPRGLCPEEREEFNILMERIFELYAKMPLDKDPSKFRKMVTAWWEHDTTLNVIFFIGNNREHERVVKFIKNNL